MVCFRRSHKLSERPVYGTEGINERLTKVSTTSTVIDKLAWHFMPGLFCGIQEVSSYKATVSERH